MVAAAVVSYCGFDVIGDHGEVVGEEFVEGFAIEVGVLGDGCVEVGDVGVVVLAVVNFHGLLIDVGFEGIGSERKWWEGIWHDGSFKLIRVTWLTGRWVSVAGVLGAVNV